MQEKNKKREVPSFKEFLKQRDKSKKKQWFLKTRKVLISEGKIPKRIKPYTSILFSVKAPSDKHIKAFRNLLRIIQHSLARTTGIRLTQFETLVFLIYYYLSKECEDCEHEIKNLKSITDTDINICKALKEYCSKKNKGN